MNLNLESKDKQLKKYYKEINEQYDIYFKTHAKGNPPESAVEPAFLNLLQYCAKKVNWKFVPKKPLPNGNIPDGTFLEPTTGIRSMGYMESKDDDDNLDAEIQTKLGTKNYPRFNILFWQPSRVVLYQKTKVRDENIAENPELLASVLNDFFSYEPFDSRSWNEAIKTFDEQMPLLAKGLLEKIEESEKNHKPFIKEFDKFYNLCKASINPNIGKPAIKEMIVQHLLTERILESIFDLKRFTSENAVAGQLDKVISSMTSKYFNRAEFLGTLNDFYVEIIKAAKDLKDFKEKQTFLNDIFERFFQGWAVKSADRLGIVYTPQSVVDFMVKSVDEILKTEFGKKHGLGSKNVHIIDPFVGTGNFIVNVIDKISPTKLAHKYEHELHCNEISLMPYYIANMNIEHAYFESVGERKEFPGICFADTFQMSEEHGGLFFNEENTKRVIKQAESPIFVVISNPPYNAHQADEMDNNKNRKYDNLEKKIKETYSKDSRATNKNALSDPYVKAIKWASDRIGDEGVVAMINNNSFVDTYAFDGMRKHLENDFDKIYHMNLRGNARTSGEKRRKEKGNIFDDKIRVSVGITFFIKKKEKSENIEIFYNEVGDYLTSDEKAQHVKDSVLVSKTKWRKLTPNKNHTWLTDGIADDFEDYPLMGDKKQKGKPDCDTMFNLFSNGVKTNRDMWAYNFSKENLEEKMKLLISTYNNELARWEKSDKNEKIDDFVVYDDKMIKWDSRLKYCFSQNTKAIFDKEKIRNSIYRPFQKRYLFHDRIVNNTYTQFYLFFPTTESEKENLTILMTDVGSEKPFMTLISDKIIDLHTVGAGCSAQTFPFYTYNEDGTGRKENITDATLEMYQKHYKDKKITKWDIFYYIYAMLHHPKYRDDFKENLKRSLPRIPFAPDFWAFSKTGKKLADIHMNYESAEIYELDEIIDKDVFPEVRYTVDKIKLNKDKTELVYNKAITLTGIPPEVYDYKLGNRSALEWIVDQYRVKTDKRSGITQDPNGFDGDERYIFDLVGKIVMVSLETVRLVKKLSKLEYK